jgi:DNA repair exonuclease SbcCD nuclease subunit
MIQIKDTRIYGLQYLGAITPKMIPIISNSIESNNDTFNILMLHYGIVGQDKKKTGMELNEQILSLHDKIDYLALGHFHKMYELPHNDSWIFNPGSSEINSISELDINHKHGVWLIKIFGKERKKWDVNFIESVNGDTDDSDSIPNRSFNSIQYIDIGKKELTNFNKTIDFIINKIKRSGLNFESITSDSDKSNLNIPILVLPLKGEISYSRMEINEKKLKEKIHESFNILDIRLLTNQIISKLDVIEIEENNNSIELIEKTVFSKMMEENEELNKQNKDLFKFLLEYKSQLLGTKINYKDLSDHISQWWDEYFGEKIEDLELIDTDAEVADLAKEEKEGKTVEKQIFDDIEFEEDPTEVFDDGSAYLNDEKEEK